jgi:hypothetical protein
MSVVIRLRAQAPRSPVITSSSPTRAPATAASSSGRHFNPLPPTDNEARLKLDMDKVKACSPRAPSVGPRRFSMPPRREAHRAQQPEKGRAARSARRCGSGRQGGR